MLEIYPETGIFNFSQKKSMGQFKEAQLYRESVILCIADPETSDEINAFSVNNYEIRRFMRRLQVKAVSDIVPRILELCSESNFQNEYIQYPFRHR